MTAISSSSPLIAWGRSVGFTAPNEAPAPPPVRRVAEDDRWVRLAIPAAAPPAAPRAAGPLVGTPEKAGHRVPHTHGRATTFWNGHYVYKGRRDRNNLSGGAWGDANKPTDYFCALPVGLRGEKGSRWWHNQKILVTNPTTGQQVVVRVQDKGPHPKTGTQIDLSPVAKEALGVHFMDNLKVDIAFAPDDAPVGPVKRA